MELLQLPWKFERMFVRLKPLAAAEPAAGETWVQIRPTHDRPGFADVLIHRSGPPGAPLPFVIEESDDRVTWVETRAGRAPEDSPIAEGPRP